jgi:mannose-6-phosphate isomerase
MSVERDRALRAASACDPVVLPANRIQRFYAGGPRIDELRGLAAGDGAQGPEEWVGSTTTSFGEATEGLSRLADGRVLRDAIVAEPVAYLGAEHLERWGPSPALLVKLLDAGERLAVHFHPGRAFAREMLGLDFGKTEAWIIVSAEPGAAMHLGFTAPVQAATVAGWLSDQDEAAMLASMREVPVRTGDVLFVPAGTVHTIGAGILLVELQEPTDLSVLLEWRRFGVSSGAEHLNLGWEQVLPALNLDAGPVAAGPVHLGDDESSVPARAGSAPVRELFPDAVAPYFRAQRIELADAQVGLEPSFSILVVLDGEASIIGEASEPLPLVGGATALLPHGAGPTILEGRGTVIRCLPPAPDVGAGHW